MRRFVFGPFEFDDASGELRRHGMRLRIRGQPLKILSMLLERPGETVGREELRRSLWPGVVSGDFEHGLNAAVNKLRQALGDSADEPRYIETLQGRGYRWVAPIEPQLRPVLEIARPAMPQAAPPRRPERRSTIVSGIVVAIVSILIVSVAYWMGSTRRQSGAGAVQIRFTVSPPPGYFLEGAGNRQSFAISPDGARLAFTAMDDSGLFQVFVRDLNSLEARALPDSAGAGTVFWHPDGRSVLFVARGKLRRAPISGEVTQALADSIPGLLSGVWLTPDSLLLSNRLIAATVASSGGTLERHPNTYAWAQSLPDGENLLHVVFDPRIGRYLGRAVDWRTSGPPIDLVETDSKVVYAQGYLLYVLAGTLLAQPFDAGALRITGEPAPVARGVCSFLPTAAGDFSVSDNRILVYQQYAPNAQLAWVDRTGRRISPASPPGLALKAARISPDGRRIGTSVYDVDRGVTDVWLFDADGRGGRRLAGPGLSHSPVWSPDSRLVVLGRAYEERPKLFIHSLEGDEAAEALPRADFQLPTDWSGDGRFIVYNNVGLPLTVNEQQGDIWAVDLERNRRLIPLVKTPHHEANAAFSPDGQWLAFTSNESGRAEVYIQALEKGETLRVIGPRHLVSRQGAQCLRWRSDGRELYYVGGDGWVYAAQVELRPAVSIGAPAPLFKISAEARAAIHALLGFDASADGSRFVIPVVTSAERPSLVVIQNWQSALEKRG